MSAPGIEIREAREGDAPAMLEYVRELTLEPGLPVLLSHERALSFTIESERKLIRRHHAESNSLWLLALHDSRIIGMLDMLGGTQAEDAHAVTLGLSVAKGWRDRGVGRALMTRAVEWARRTAGVSRIELEVFADNRRAIHLYEEMGFVAEGLRRRAFIKEGVAIDSLIMALLV